MGTVFRVIVRWLLLLLLLPGVVGWVVFHFGRLMGGFEGRTHGWVLLWVIVGFAFHRLFRRGRGKLANLIHFLDTFEHELTHTIVGLFFLRPPSTFHVTDRSGGHVRLEKSNWLISLSPYLWPLWCSVAALLGVVVQAQWNRTIFAATLLLYGFFLSRLKSELHLKQTDLISHGLFHSIIVVLLFHLMLFPFVLLLSLDLWSWQEAAKGFFHFYPSIWSQFTSHSASVLAQ